MLVEEVNNIENSRLILVRGYVFLSGCQHPWTPTTNEACIHCNYRWEQAFDSSDLPILEQPGQRATSKEPFLYWEMRNNV